MIPVRAPRKPVRPAATVTEPMDRDDDDFRLSDPVTRPTSELVDQVNAATSTAVVGAGATGQGVSEQTGDATGGGPRQSPTGKPSVSGGALPGLDVIAASARSVLEKAQAEAAEAERKKAKLPPRPFVTGIVSFLFESNAATRWGVLTVMLQVVLTLLAFAFSGHMAAVLFSMVAAGAALFFLVTAAVCYVAILHDTANGYETIEGWPGVNFLDWMGDSLYVINALFASATPGILLGQVTACAGAPRFLAFFGGLMTFYVFFPLFLLSMSDEGSPLSLVSGSVWRSLLAARSLWIRFYLITAGIVLAALIAVAVAAVSSFLISVPVSLMAIALTMVYFRLLGRLAWCLAELRS
jgi:hypothetical protein